MKKFKWWEEDTPVNATGPAVVGTGDDSSTVVVKKKTKVYRRKKRRMTEKEIEEARNYRKEYDEYHAQPEQRERNAARLRARRQMEKWGKVKKFDKKDVHHKDNNPLNNEEDNLAVTTQNWNRSEPRLRKEEIINIEERELTPKELKRREEIAQDLNDADFKKRYGDRWKEVKMGVATNMAKKESIDEADDPKADKLKAKELKVAKAIAQAQLAIAKEQERVQKLTDFQNKIKDQASEEKTMSKKYLETKTGSLEEATLGIWQDAAEELHTMNEASPLVKKAIKIAKNMGGDMTGAVEAIEKLKKGLSKDKQVVDALRLANEQKEESSKVDGRTKSYKEALRRIRMRQERKRAKSTPVQEALYYELPNGKKLDITQLSLSDRRKLIGKKGLFKVVDGKLVPRENTKAWRKKAADEFGKYMGSKEEVTEEALEEKLKKGFFRTPNGDDVWVQNDPSVLPSAWAKKVEAGKIDPTKMDFSGPSNKWKEIKASYDPELEEATGDKEAYQKFFQAALKKFGVNSPADLKGDDKKKFYDYIDKNWTADHEEQKEGTLPPALKKAIAAKKAKKDGKEEDEAKTEGLSAGQKKLPPALQKAILAKQGGKKDDKEDEDEDKDPVGEKKNIDEAALDDLRKIVDTKSMGKVSGTKVDLFSASAMIKVYDSLNDKNKKKVEQMIKDKRGILTFQKFAFSQVK